MRRHSLEAVPIRELTASLPWPEGWTPTGIVGVLEQLVVKERRETISAKLEQRLADVTVVMDRPHDPHNGAAVLRSCDAFGVQNVHVVAPTRPFLISKVVSRRTERWLDIHEYGAYEGVLPTLQAQGMELVTTHPHGSMQPEDLATIPRLALVLGNEHWGVHETLVRAAGRSVCIPMRGFVESLNVSVSAAILLHHAVKGRTGNLSLPERERLYARGLYYSVKRADLVLSAYTPR
jgi:tRNA (guanosine-2'-O-)-methyltransferase